MAQKAYSKHSEYRTYSTKGSYDDGDFDSMKAELLPSKYGSLVQPANGAPGNKEYFYEYKEERDPGKNYDRKDLHTVEQYEFSHSPSNVSVTPRPLPAITSSSHQHSYSRKGDLSQNIEELDSLLDDLQRDQERKPYKSGYSSDTMESSSFDYRSSNTPVKSSGYSSLSKVEREEWLPAPAPVPATLSREVNREVIRKQVTESRMVPAGQTGAAVCDKCHPPLAAGGPMNKVTTTVKTYTYEVPADQDPSLLPIPGSQQLLSSDRSYLREDHTHLNTSTPVGSPVRHSPLPSSHYRETTTSVTGAAHSSSGHPGHVCPHTGHSCPHAAPAVPHPTCPHCSLKITAVQGCPDCPPHVCPGRDVTLSSHYSTTLEGRGAPASPLYAVPVDLNRQPPHGGPPGSAVHKYSSSNYSYSSNSTGPHSHPHPQPAPSPFPLPGEPRASPGPRTLQEPPKKLDDLLADFPGHESIPPGSGELRQRPNPARGPGGAINGIEQQQQQQKAVTLSKNIAGPAVYYPPGHENFSGKGEAAAYQQAGGGYKAKGSYKYEAEASSKSKSKSSSGGAVVPVCLPLCCAMPCVLL